VTESPTVPLPGRRVVAIYGFSLALGILVTGWIVTLVAQRGRAPRSAEVAGVDIGGQSKSSVRREVSKLADGFRTAAVEIDTGEGVLRADAVALGLSVRIDDTVNKVMSSGAGIPIIGWPFAAFQSHKVPVSLDVDQAKLANELARLEESNGRRPLEPTLRMASGLLEAVPGQPGQALSPDDVVHAVRAAGFQRGVIKVAVKRRERAPTHAVAEAEQLARRANDLTARGLVVEVGAISTQLTAEQLRSWMRAEIGAQGLALGVDAGRANYELQQLMGASRVEPVNARIELRNEAPVVVPGADGQVCCGDDAARQVFQAVEAQSTTAVALPTVKAAPLITTEFAEKLAVVQKVSEFTTPHKAGEARVTNIHRIADLMRGVVIPPGGTLSINGQIGPRTADKGFVDAPVIANGFHEHDVGGGVSQFATTMMNAAFFAGLDLPQYQSHSLYISRYPFGREATMGFPTPDLQIHNPTPFGILIWPTYTDRSLTVALYSSPYVLKVEQGAQTATLGGQSCVDVKTERRITYLDNTVKVDFVKARYRALEGLNCGEPLPPGVKLQRVPGQPPLPLPPTAGAGVFPVAPPETEK
jgi:vancomycin resistance protein YoaR